MLRFYKHSDNNRHAMLHKYCIVKMATAMQDLKKRWHYLSTFSYARKITSYLKHALIYVLCENNDEIT